MVGNGYINSKGGIDMGYIPPVHHQAYHDYANRMIRHKRHNYMKVGRMEHLRDYDRRREAFPPPFPHTEKKRVNNKKKKQAHFSRYI